MFLSAKGVQSLPNQSLANGHDGVGNQQPASAQPSPPAEQKLKLTAPQLREKLLKERLRHTISRPSEMEGKDASR